MKVKGPIIIVSKKIVQKASQRNLIKRRVRSILRQFKEKIRVERIVINQEMVKLPYTDFKNKIESILKKQ